MNQQERKYVGRGKKAGNFDLVNFSISESKVKESWFEYNGEHYLKLTVGGLREKDQYGKTHSVWINDYKPNEGQPTAVKKAPVGEVQDLPF